MATLPYKNFTVSDKPVKGECSISGVTEEVYDFTWIGDSGKEHTFQVSKRYLPMYTKGLTHEQCSR